MRWGTRWPLMVACLVASACISDFENPLGPAEEGFIEPPLLGTWDCTSADDQLPTLMTMMDFDGKQYYIQSREEGKSDESHSRAIAARIEDARFLSVQELGTDKGEKWVFLEYVLSGAGRLTFRIVDPSGFDDVREDAPSVRQRLAERLQDPEAFLGELSCTRRSPQAVEPKVGG